MSDGGGLEIGQVAFPKVLLLNLKDVVMAMAVKKVSSSGCRSKSSIQSLLVGKHLVSIAAIKCSIY